LLRFLPARGFEISAMAIMACWQPGSLAPGAPLATANSSGISSEADLWRSGLHPLLQALSAQRGADRSLGGVRGVECYKPWKPSRGLEFEATDIIGTPTPASAEKAS
jgi:hypothetical protein